MSESTWLIIDRIGMICGIVAFLGATYSALQWWRHLRREKQLGQPVPIRLTTEDGNTIRYQLPYQPPRRLITRAEVLGLLGMIPSAEAGKRFEWVWLHQPEFMQVLEEIHLGRKDALEIRITDAEVAQISLPRPIPPP